MRIALVDWPRLEAAVIAAGHGDDIEWAENLKPPANADEFAAEIIFVICNSGMKHTVARRIYDRVMEGMRAGRSMQESFRHPGKCAAIADIWQHRDKLFRWYCSAPDKLAFLAGLPWIGPITKYHVAKNFGLQYAKPDVHLTRLAKTFNTTPQAMCDVIAKRTGYKIATVDTLLWRAAALGILNTRTGEINPTTGDQHGKPA